MKRTVDIYVIEQTSSGKALKCSRNAKGEDVFYLPKSQVKPYGPVKKNQFAKFDIPEWLCLKHWQICGREEFEAEKRRVLEEEGFNA
jgi:hypothetical protein